MANNAHQRERLERYWRQAAAAVAGDACVADALKQEPDFRPDQIIAIGKAAGPMTRGALQTLKHEPHVLVVQKKDCDDGLLAASANVRIIEAGHPTPDKHSIDAGAAILEAVTRLGPDAQLLMLVSGGTSALTELPVDGISLADIQQATDRLIASGLPIGDINADRARLSQIKGGKLLATFKGRDVLSLLISDVQGDDPLVIGSGTGSTHCAAQGRERIIASNSLARSAASTAAISDGQTLLGNEESLYGDFENIAENMSRELSGAGCGIRVWGGEPTVTLPDQPGTGGRNLSLALALAIRLRGTTGISVLVAGTDGDDGSSGVAGAFIDGQTVTDVDSAYSALKKADAYSWFRETDALFDCGTTGTNGFRGTDALFDCGPTGTNVMDIAIAIKGDD
jgi:glycerate 2-kinase